MKYKVIVLIVLSLATAASAQAPAHEPHPNGQAAFEYLKGLEGQWVVDGGDEGKFGWEFDVTSRGSVIVERLKVGTFTEMTTVYHLDNDTLVAAHYCQLGNQPRLTAVKSKSEAEGDLHFVCDGNVTSTESHAELHMHGVHFKDNGDRLSIWMDMVKDDEVAFQTFYELVRTGQEDSSESSK